MKKSMLVTAALLVTASAMARETPRELLQSIKVPVGKTDADQIVLKNDSFVDESGQAYLQLGFVEGEKAGIWVKVPETIKRFKVDYFRILYGGVALTEKADKEGVVFFTVGIAKQYNPAMPADIENAAQLTPGPYWNDIPAKGANSVLGCAGGGDFIGAAIEFGHSGAPSIYRDFDGLNSVKGNTLYAVPGGWNYSVAYGLKGDWVLRVVGHEAGDGECS